MCFAHGVTNSFIIMFTYAIYHATGANKFKEIAMQKRKLVGSVEAASLEEAFRLSQNGEKPWNEQKPCRSTSVGDMIHGSDGYYLVKNVGFELLSQL